jgi:L-fuconolactonase
MVVDSHQHFWSLSAPWFDWPTPDLKPIYRDYAPGDLQRRIESAGVTKTVIVQVAPNVEETRSLLTLAESTDFVGAVVGWVDLEQPADIAVLEQLAAHPKFRGVRPMIQSIPDPEWMLRPELRTSLNAVQRLGLTFDALVKPPHLDALIAFVDRYPDLPVVVDHGAKPEIAAGRDGFEPWAPRMTELAKRPQVRCKLSGLLTEAGDRTRLEDLLPFIDHLIDVFGPGRLMWGSDWPVVELVTPYGTWFDLARAAIARLSRSEQQSILGDVARDFYRI